MEQSHFFCIAGHGVCISFAAGQANSIDLLPSFATFKSERDKCPTLLSLSVDDTLKTAKDKKLIKVFDTGNGDTLVYHVGQTGGYQFIIRDLMGRDCSLLIADADFSSCRCALNGTQQMRAFGLNNAVMLAFAYAASRHATLMIHASCALQGGKAYPFTAKSGTGKSTHTSLWMSHIEGTELLNDDNPIIRIVDGKPMVYGSPWSGKTPCYRNISAPLGALVKIERAPSNSIERLGAVQSFAVLLPACSSMKWDKAVNDNICRTITRVIETTPIYTLHCLPDREAAILCHKTIAK